MNRIILVGNGFDLAHRLPTAYADFIKNYRAIKLYRLINNDNLEDVDKLCKCIIPDTECRKQLNGLRLMTNSPYQITPFDHYIYGKRLADVLNQLSFKYDSKFFEDVNISIDTYDWVDIESIYYKWLKYIFKKDNNTYSTPIKLNDELDFIRERLTEYLLFVQHEFIKPQLVNNTIKCSIYEPFNIDDISNEGQAQFKIFLKERLNDECNPARLLEDYGYTYNKENILSYKNNLKYGSIVSSLNGEEYNSSKHIEKVVNGEKIPEYFLLPNHILLLNFNYTTLADLYISESSSCTVNHIHGELNKNNNSIIFGYGDELDEDYKEIAKLNDNDYLKNIKSIRYLETDNYRKLLKFINSAPFQIYIMGHSCGNSDRTLLNTLFEHKNCVSIKPYYHLRSDGSDNYIDIVQNISRNFNSMQKMRDRVVNKTYCKPLIVK